MGEWLVSVLFPSFFSFMLVSSEVSFFSLFEDTIGAGGLAAIENGTELYISNLGVLWVNG